MKNIKKILEIIVLTGASLFAQNNLSWYMKANLKIEGPSNKLGFTSNIDYFINTNLNLIKNTNIKSFLVGKNNQGTLLQAQTEQINADTSKYRLEFSNIKTRVLDQGRAGLVNCKDFFIGIEYRKFLDTKATISREFLADSLSSKLNLDSLILSGVPFYLIGDVLLNSLHGNISDTKVNKTDIFERKTYSIFAGKKFPIRNDLSVTALFEIEDVLLQYKEMTPEGIITKQTDNKRINLTEKILIENTKEYFDNEIKTQTTFELKNNEFYANFIGAINGNIAEKINYNTIIYANTDIFENEKNNGIDLEITNNPEKKQHNIERIERLFEINQSNLENRLWRNGILREINHINPVDGSMIGLNIDLDKKEVPEYNLKISQYFSGSGLYFEYNFTKEIGKAVFTIAKNNLFEINYDEDGKIGIYIHMNQEI